MARSGKGPFRIEVSKEFDAWVTALGSMDQIDEDARLAWQGGVEVLFGATQDVVHVVTGNLKRSGHAETTIVGPTLVGEVAYDAEYAMDEILRGGSHDFMQRGLEQVQGVFEGSLLAAVAAQVEKGFR